MNAKYNYIDAQMRADINYNIICNIVIMYSNFNVLLFEKVNIIILYW